MENKTTTRRLTLEEMTDILERYGSATRATYWSTGMHHESAIIEWDRVTEVFSISYEIDFRAVAQASETFDNLAEAWKRFDEWQETIDYAARLLSR